MKKLVLGICTLTFAFSIAISFFGFSSADKTVQRDGLPPAIAAYNFS